VSEQTDERLDEIARLLALSIKRGMGSQNEAILAFLEIGLEPPRIAELLGTTSATVRAARAAEKKAAEKGKKGAG
jgi:hypothetical protein